ncbi:hypothetical protein D3C71_1267950 [compost metagenome]
MRDVEAAGKLQCGAGAQRGKGYRAQPIDMGDRQRRVNAIGLPGSAGMARGRGRMTQIFVREHHALGRASGAAGVDQHGDLLSRVRLHGFGARGRIRFGAGQAQPGDQDLAGAVARAMGAGLLGQPAGGEHQPGFAVRLDGIDFRAGHARVDHDCPGVQATAGQNRGQLRAAAFAHNEKTVAGAQSLSLQIGRQRFDHGIEFFIGPAALVGNQGRIPGQTGNVPADQLMDTKIGIGKINGHMCECAGLLSERHHRNDDCAISITYVNSCSRDPRWAAVEGPCFPRRGERTLPARAFGEVCDELAENFRHGFARDHLRRRKR